MNTALLSYVKKTFIIFWAYSIIAGTLIFWWNEWKYKMLKVFLSFCPGGDGGNFLFLADFSWMFYTLNMIKNYTLLQMIILHGWFYTLKNKVLRFLFLLFAFWDSGYFRGCFTLLFVQKLYVVENDNSSWMILHSEK